MVALSFDELYAFVELYRLLYNYDTFFPEDITEHITEREFIGTY